MAERVQQDLELMLTELEQMQRVGLLSAEETKMVIKKRKRYEYKMQKQTKIKEDILAYIQYECSLLDLIELRRDKIGYLHKKNEIDDAIAKRIHKLFKITEHRFGHVDEKVWITHLGFLQRMHWKAECGKVLKRFTQASGGQSEDVWIFASRFQDQQIGLSRTLLLEGLRFHPESIKIYREYFMLEIGFCKDIKANPELGEDLEDPQAVSDGEIVKTVFEKALETTQSPLFAAEMLTLVQKSKLYSLYKKLTMVFQDKYADQISTWTLLASLTLYPDPNQERSVKQKFQDCQKILLQGLDQIQSLEFVQEALKLTRQISDEHSELDGQCGILAFKILQKGDELDLLNEDLKALLND